MIFFSFLLFIFYFFVELNKICTQIFQYLFQGFNFEKNEPLDLRMSNERKYFMTEQSFFFIANSD